MFQAAVTGSRCVQQEQVTIEVRRLAEQTHVLLADRFEVARQPIEIGAYPAADRDRMRHAARVEFGNLEYSHFDGMVNQLGIIRCRVPTETIALGARDPHRRRDLPGSRVRRRQDLQITSLVFLANDFQETTGAVEETVRRIEVCAANAGIERVHSRDNGQRRPGGRRLPGALVELVQGDGFAVRLRPNLDDVARIVANHVAARYPGRHAQLLAVGIGGFDSQADFEQVSRRIDRLDLIAVGHQDTSGSVSLSVRHFAEPPALRNSVSSTSLTWNPASIRRAFSGSDARCRNT